MSKKNEISTDALVSKISEELTYYQRSVIDKAMTEETKNAMKSLVEKTKATAPVGKRTKHYRDSITSKVLHKSDLGYGVRYRELWFVKGSDYRLSHLLNNGHAKKNGGRVEGTQFITKATDEVETAYLESLKKAIENGGR
jgi:hypothetical protein